MKKNKRTFRVEKAKCWTAVAVQSIKTLEALAMRVLLYFLLKEGITLLQVLKCVCG